MVVKLNRQSREDVFRALGISYLGQFLGQRINELVHSRCKRKGFLGLKVSHGYIIQHLVETNRPVVRTGSELARRMGVTQQAASKVISELVRMGVVQVKQAADRRAKEVRLSARGWQGVQYARETRARLENELAHHLGERSYAQTKEALQACLDLVGGVEAIQSRRVRQPE